MDILLGYEIGSGKEVRFPNSHIIVAGLTQLSGKTTTLEALLTRGKLNAIVFKTKPGERGFAQGSLIPPYFKEKSDWQYVSSLLEATLKEKLKFERSWIMSACKGTSSLLDVKRNVEQQLANPKLRDLNRSVYTTLDEYLQLILPQISTTSFSHTLVVGPGINIMDLQRLKDELQSLVIRSVLENVLREMHDTVVVIPEAWKFLPQERGNPAKQAAEEFIRQGATNRNYLWIDSQDITGVDKTPLKSVATWILGLQAERNEVHHTLEQMPIPKRHRPTEDEIMTLQKGQFYLCTPGMMKKVYVQPAWLDAEKAKAVARGEASVKEMAAPATYALPALPRIPDVKDDEKVRTLEELKKEIVDVRKDFVDRMNELHEYVSKLAERVSTVMLKVGEGARTESAGVPIDDIVAKVQSKLVRATPVFENHVQRQALIQEILRQIPRSTNGATYTVEPLAALQKQWQQGAKEMLVGQIRNMSERETKVLSFIESAGRVCTQTEIAVKCLGLASGEGGNGATVRELTVQLEAKGLVRRDTKHSRVQPNLKPRIAELMSVHGASEQEVEEVYKHIIAEFLQPK